MSLFGDHYAGAYEGHIIELIRNNWDKTLKLLIDGEVVASTSCNLPRPIALTGSLEQAGVRHEVVARSIPHHLIFARDTIEIDGNQLSLLHAAPRGMPPLWIIVLMAIAG